MNDLYDIDINPESTDLSYGKDNSVVNLTLSVDTKYLHNMENRCKTTETSQVSHNLSRPGFDFKLIRSPFKGLSHLFVQENLHLTTSFSPTSQTSNFTNIDHVLVAVEPGLMNLAAEFYSKKLGFESLGAMGTVENRHEDIVVHAPDGEGLRMKVMDYTKCSSLCFSGRDNLKAKFVLGDSLNPSGRDQICNFIRNNNNHSGVQHIALHTGDIITTCENLKMAGIKFLNIPQSYYKDQTWRRCVEDLGFDPQQLEDNNLLLDYNFAENDRRGKSFLLQIFTEPIFPSENTIFLEVIQRCGSAGFGENNIRSLWKAVRDSHLKLDAVVC